MSELSISNVKNYLPDSPTSRSPAISFAWGVIHSSVLTLVFTSTLTLDLSLSLHPPPTIPHTLNYLKMAKIS